MVKDGPLHVEQLGAFDIKNPSNNNTMWKFPHDNSDNIKKAKLVYKEVLRDVVIADLNMKAEKKEKIIEDPFSVATKLIDIMRI